MTTLSIATRGIAALRGASALAERCVTRESFRPDELVVIVNELRSALCSFQELERVAGGAAGPQHELPYVR